MGQTFATPHFEIAVREFGQRQRLPLHRHDRPHLCVMLRGHARDVDGRISTELASAHAVYRAGGSTHCVDFGARGASAVILEFGEPAVHMLDALGARSDRRVCFRSHVTGALGWRIQNELQGNDTLAPIVIEGLALELVGEVFRRRRWQDPTGPTWVQSVRDRLERECASPPSVEDLARAAGVHPVHLVEQFRRRVGVTPGAYLRRVRVERAATLLAESEQPIADVALAVGYCDQSHLSNAFKAATGMTPSRFRRLHRSPAGRDPAGLAGR